MIFIDSSFLLALLIKSDINHHRALELGDNFYENKMINTTVLTETLNAFNAVGGKTGVSLYENLKEMFEIDYLTINDFDESIEIYLKYDSSINYSDCTILKSMQKNNISKIATFDSDFKKVNGIEIIS
jgi:hypothetical protein